MSLVQHVEGSFWTATALFWGAELKAAMSGEHLVNPCCRSTDRRLRISDPSERNRKRVELCLVNLARYRRIESGKPSGSVRQDRCPILPVARRSGVGVLPPRAAWGGTFPEPKPTFPGRQPMPNKGARSRAGSPSSGKPDHAGSLPGSEVSLVAHFAIFVCPWLARVRRRRNQVGPRGYSPTSPLRTRRIERPQIAGLLADAHRVHRQPELLRQRHHDAAARAAVELGDHQAGHIHHLLEHAHLLHARSARWWRPAPAAPSAARSGPACAARG